MDDLITTFHIDFKLLIAQFINFGLVFFVLYFLVVKPLIKLLEERSQKIEQGLNYAAEMENKIKAIKEEEEAIILKAKEQSNDIVGQATALAQIKKKEISDKAKEEVKNIIANAKAEVKEMKETMMTELKQETLNLVVLTCEKIIPEIIDKKTDQKVITQKINEVLK